MGIYRLEPILKQGDVGHPNSVRDLKWAINKLHTEQGLLADDGTFDARCDAAVRAIRRFFKLDDDGVAGATTWATLSEQIVGRGIHARILSKPAAL